MGRVVITTIYNAMQYPTANNFAIVRSLREGIPLTQLRALAPSTRLFSFYMQNRNNWSAELFDAEYVPTFLYDMKHSVDARFWLNKIARTMESEDYVLSCFCHDERTCHRSIIAGLLQGAGLPVEVDSGADYSRYYQMYKEV